MTQPPSSPAGADRVVFVERAGLVPLAREALLAGNGRTVLIALSPEVMRRLDEEGAAYRVPEDFLARGALEARGLENYARLERLGDCVERLLERLPEALRLNPVRLHFYSLKVLVDTFGLRAMEAAAVIRAHPGASFEVLAYRDDPLWAGEGAIHPMEADGPIYSEAVAFAGGAMKAAVRVRLFAGGPGRGRHPGPVKSALRSAWRLCTLLPGLALRRRPVWHVGDRAHDIPDLLPPLQRGLGVLSWENTLHGWPGTMLAAAFGADVDRGAEAALPGFWKEAAALMAGHDAFAFAGLDCFPPLERALERMFVRETLRAARVHAAVRRLARWRRPSSALTVNTPYPENIAAVWALRAEGVPVVFVQEGGLYGYCESPMHHFCELAWGDYFLAYGPGCSRYLNESRLSPRQNALALPVGAFRLRRLASAAPSSGAAGTVLYAVSDFHHNVRYAPTCYGEREYYRVRKAVLEALLASPFERIIYKAVPGKLAKDPLLPLLNRHRGRVFPSEEPLLKASAAAACFVVDWPTTTLLELLCTRKPVHVLLDPVVTRPLPAGLALLRRRAAVHTDVASLAASLREAGALGGAAADGAFLEAFGTCGPEAWDEAALTRFFAALPAPGRNP